MQETHYEQIYESRVGADTLSNTNEPSAAALIRAQGQQSKGSIRLHGKDRKPHGGVKKRMG